MTLKIEIKMDNAAFSESGSEVARILTTWAEEIEHYDLKSGEQYIFRDFNGNKVGTAEVVP